MIAGALLIGTPFFVVFGRLSDRIGRKPIIMAGLLLACLTYFPLFKGITHYANPALEEAIAAAPVVVTADPADCSFQFNPVGTSKFTTSCDIAKAALVKRGVPYKNDAAPAGTLATVRWATRSSSPTRRAGRRRRGHRRPRPGSGRPAGTAARRPATPAETFTAELDTAVNAAGYPAKADPARINTPMVVLLLTVLVIYVTMVYGPIAAMLVEMFPTRIRYTSMSLPYHIGNGWFGGFLPTTSFAIVAATGNIYSGLWYPIVIAGGTFVIGMLFVRETKDIDIYATTERDGTSVAPARADPFRPRLSVPGKHQSSQFRPTRGTLPSPRRGFDTAGETGLLGADMPQQILIADDHPLMRSALRQAVAQAFAGVAVREAAGFEQLRGMLTETASPDLVLLDLHMPGMSGFIGLMMLRSEYPAVPVIVVSAAEDAATIQRSIDYGASGFVPKSAPIGQVAEAIRAVLDGHLWVPAPWRPPTAPRWAWRKRR